MMRIAVIPARAASARFPNKPLVEIDGLPMVVQVVRRCIEAESFDRIIVATDHEKIQKLVQHHGHEAVMTSPGCPTGTDRVAEVVDELEISKDALVLNVQGDEPAMHPDSLKTLAELVAERDVHMATLVRPLNDAERTNPNVVKVVRGAHGDALYFSRADIPFVRHEDPPPERWAHLGVYGYRVATLEHLASLPPVALEHTEGLEQLRALSHGIRIKTAVTNHVSLGVDRPDDVAGAEALVRARKRGKPPR